MNNIEDKNVAWNETFFKKRDIAQCFSVAVSFLSNRFFKILQLAVPVILISAALLTSCLYQAFNLKLEKQPDVSWLMLWAPLVAVIVMALMTAFVYRCIRIRIESLNIYSVRWKFIYNKVFFSNAAKAFVIYAMVAALAVLVCMAGWSIAALLENEEDGGINVMALTIKVVAVLITVTLAVPANAVMNRILLDNKKVLESLKKGYALGWNNWGLFFSLELIVAVCVFIIAVLVMTPAFVVAEMHYSAILSLRDGDNVVIPEYLTAIMVAAMFISSCFFVLLTFLKILPHAYLYASITTQEQ